MRNLIIGILLTIGFVLTAQTYHPVNLKVVDSIKVGTSANSVWWTNMFAGSWIQTNLGLDYTMDGTPEYSDTLFYYVDQDGGNNSNTGLSTGQSWATLQYANDNVRIPTTGDTTVIIALDPRDTWPITTYLNLTASGASNTNRVIWDGGHANWSQPGDTAEIQNFSIPTQLIRIVVCKNMTLQNLIIDGESNGDYGIFMGSFSGSGNNDTISNITIQNCDIRYTGSGSGQGSGIFIRPRFNEADNIKILNNRIRHHDLYCVAFYHASEDQGYSSKGSNNCLVSGNTFEYWHENSAENPYAVLLRNETDSITVTDNTFRNGQNSPGGISIEHGTDVYPDKHWTTNAIIRYNDMDAMGTSAMNFSAGSAVTASVYGNILWSKDLGDLDFRGCVKLNSATWTGAEIHIYNNTMIADSNTYVVNINDNDFDTLSFTNNIYYINDARQFLISAGANYSHQNNLYYKTGSTRTANWVTDGGSSYATAGAVAGWEPTAQTTDPTFTVEFTNLNLQTGSPAIDNGTAISGYTEDRQGVAVVNPPNIGQSETTEDP